MKNPVSMNATASFRPAILFLLGAAGLLSASDRINQSELFYYSYAAPASAAAGAVASLDNDLSAGFLNPASIATVQQVKIGSIFGDLGGNSAFASVSGAIPTRRGVLGLNGRYFKNDAGSRSLLDTAYGGHAVWAKTFTDNLSFGLGLKLHGLSFVSTNKALQLGIDAGGLYRRELEANPKRGFNFTRWGVGLSVLNIGNPVLLTRSKNHPTNVGMPFQIRLGGSLSADIVKAWSAGLTCDLFLANFTKFGIRVGVENRLFDHILLNAGYSLNSGFNTLSLGLAYTMKIRTTEGRLSFAYLPWNSGRGTLFTGLDLVFGTVDTTPPKADLGFDGDAKAETVYISPNYDGTRDTVTVNLAVKDNTALENWSVDVLDDNDQVVRKYQNPDIRTLKGKLTFLKIMTRMFEREKEAAVPAKLTWDGKDEKGRVVADGSYKIRVTASDENKNAVATPSKTIVIDMTPPKADLKSDLTLFSPNGDGAKDTVTVYQNTEGNDSWNAEFRSADGTPVRRYSWDVQTPDAKIVWDGTDDKGRALPNGVYGFYLHGVDKAGNAVDRKISNITLLTDKQSAGVDASAEVFSPNADGVLDEIVFTPFLTSDAGLETWELRLIDDKGQPIRTFAGKKKLPSKVVWDGTDENSKLGRDGSYFYRFKAVFANGDHPESFSKSVVVDDTPPQATIGLNTDLFSPDGDGRDDVLGITLAVGDPSGFKDWSLLIRDELNRTVKSFGGNGAPANRLDWDGLKDDGSSVKGGEVYTAILRVTDTVNNTTESPQALFKIDATPPDIRMTVKNRIFSPDGDGQADLQEFDFSRFDRKSLARWKLAINLYDRNTKTELPASEISGTNLPGSVVWDGVRDDGTLVQGGQIYKVVFTAADRTGNSVTLKDQFAIDSTPPYVELKLDPQLFSPDDDGVNDVENISIVQRDQKRIASWSVSLYPLRDDGKGGLFKRFVGTNALSAGPIAWNGLSDSGELVESAQDYEVDLAVRDVLGNVTQLVNTLYVDILIIKTPWGLKIRISNIKFEVDKATLTSEKTFKILDKIARILLKYRTYKVEVEGHTDFRKTSGVEYNRKLSQNRAQSVIDYLAGKGVEADRLRPVGRGFSIPAYPNDSEENMAKNRRVEFLLYKEGWPAEPAGATNAGPTTRTNRP